MSIVRIDAGARMCQATVHNGIVYTAGQVAEGANVAEQTKKILAQIDDILAKAGTDKTKILSVTVWLCDMSTFGELNSVYDTWVHKASPPCRAAVHSPELALPAFKVEIQVTCAI
eukprot:CFRG8536T1